MVLACIVYKEMMVTEGLNDGILKEPKDGQEKISKPHFFKDREL